MVVSGCSGSGVLQLSEEPRRRVDEAASSGLFVSVLSWSVETA